MSKNVFMNLRTKEDRRDRIKRLLDLYNETYKPIRNLTLSDLLSEGVEKFERENKHLLEGETVS